MAEVGIVNVKNSPAVTFNSGRADSVKTPAVLEVFKELSSVNRFSCISTLSANLFVMFKLYVLLAKLSGTFPLKNVVFELIQELLV